jgi:hypothetical protein
MSISTIPIFYYIDPVTKDNQILNFVEPNVSASELTATIAVGSRSMTDLMTAVEVALNDAGDNEYTVTFDRDTRIVTISADDDFNLLVSTGSNVGIGVYTLIGYTGADRTGAATYDGDTALGLTYSPQTLPQSFKNFDNNKAGIRASVNESADGTIEVISYGTRQFMEFNIDWITDLAKGSGNFIENNQSALSEINAFLTFAIKKTNIEWMEDRDARSTFDTVLLESTAGNRQGTGYELKELFNRQIQNYFETGMLKFRKV